MKESLKILYNLLDEEMHGYALYETAYLEAYPDPIEKKLLIKLLKTRSKRIGEINSLIKRIESKRK